MGHEIHLNRPVKKMFVNGPLAFGRRGYIEVEKTARPDRFKTSIILPNNQRTLKKTEKLTGLVDMLDYMKAHKPVKQGVALN